MAGYESVGSLGTASNPFVVATLGGSGSSTFAVEGTVASGSVDSGFPVKVGGIVTSIGTANNLPVPQLAAGTRTNFITNRYGGQLSQIITHDGYLVSGGYSGDGVLNTALISLAVLGFNSNWNGTTWDRSPGNTTGSFVVSVPSASTVGVTQLSVMSAASVNATVVKAAKGKVYGFQIFNTTASAKYVRLYNKATAPSGADTPVRRIMVPANGVASYHVGQGLDGFGAGIAFTATGAPADADATALAAGDLIINIDYA